MPASLSLTVIMRDEELHVPRLLSTAHIYADEIVIVDTGSVDRTKEEARKFTPLIYDFAWCNDFSAARNYGLERCTKDFVMWLDADDVVLPEDAKRIRRLISGEVGWDVVMLPYHYAHDAQGRTTLLTRRERIFRNGRGIRFEYPVHECLKYPAGAVVANNTDINIYHRNLKRREPSNARNLRLLSAAVEDSRYRADFRMWWLLAAEEAPQKSILYYAKVLKDFGPQLAASLHSEIWVQYARKLLLADRPDRALEAVGPAIALFPLWREPFFIAGQIHWRAGRYPEALRMFQIAGTIAPPALGIGNLDTAIYDGDDYYEWLFVAYYQMNDRAGMRQTIEEALAHNPANANFLQRRREYGSAVEAKALQA